MYFLQLRAVWRLWCVTNIIHLRVKQAKLTKPICVKISIKVYFYSLIMAQKLLDIGNLIYLLRFRVVRRLGCVKNTFARTFVRFARTLPTLLHCSPWIIGCHEKCWKHIKMIVVGTCVCACVRTCVRACAVANISNISTMAIFILLKLEICGPSSIP
jgi:hypothetical protein